MNQSQPSLSREQIEEIIVAAIQTLNLSRRADDQLQETTEAALYSKESRLDSLGLVSLLIEVEEGLRDAGVELTLSDERAMSQKHSPFRSVHSLADYIDNSLRDRAS